ncbi:hypothetical protein CCR97_08120 [Rhodoplanes elegans]|uniref:Uncharacterized protein n=1 Tax=Rhodoplanes elegans TaxID=29408 RepID=A0A327KPY7_9BRAD|nr:hypothetical protein [Rhodoplanes elegans]MBK5958177.1 hypothetical protein [Rhodoplanes elegans]RAI40461.1 hypothetical protein CH338_06365 [Rhodoplanes elegans]
MAPRACLHLCCNRHEDGSFAGRVSAIEVARRGESVALEHWSRGVRLTLDDGGLRLLRRRCVVLDSKQWVGNWSWNLYVVPVADVAAVIEAAMSAGFTCESATGEHAIHLSELLDARRAGPWAGSSAEIEIALAAFGECA